MNAHIVVGLGYGDEGKGITTDYLCSTLSHPIVIRYSGGQQAGHTVIKDGVKHIHSNFGAGTLRGVPTYFSEFTTFYPATILREKKRLAKKGVKNPLLILHPLAKMTTPFDVFANRECPNTKEHGTCGLGIGKTMKRHESPFHLYAIDLLNRETLVQKIKNIGKLYYGFDDKMSDDLLDEFADFWEAIDTLELPIAGYDMLKNYNNLIFEGSQGILLDMTHGVFPNVTYSNTTSKNAMEICDRLEIGVREREVYYITRTYHTRHGAGVFKEQAIDLKNNHEEINVNNIYQGQFKVAPLDYDLLNYALKVDSIYNNSFSNLVVTCNDQFNKIDYNRVAHTFLHRFESHSPDSKDFVKVY